MKKPKPLDLVTVFRWWIRRSPAEATCIVAVGFFLLACLYRWAIS
jgi:hypothetical protein